MILYGVTHASNGILDYRDPYTLAGFQIVVLHLEPWPLAEFQIVVLNLDRMRTEPQVILPFYILKLFFLAFQEAP